jgi:hypothetical protein
MAHASRAPYLLGGFLATYFNKCEINVQTSKPIKPARKTKIAIFKPVLIFSIMPQPIIDIAKYVRTQNPKMEGNAERRLPFLGFYFALIQVATAILMFLMVKYTN